MSKSNDKLSYPSYEGSYKNFFFWESVRAGSRTANDRPELPDRITRDRMLGDSWQAVVTDK